MNNLPIDIVVPVYNAYDDLMLCVQSVRRHTRRDQYRLILINDASTDLRIASYFGDLEPLDGESIVLLSNGENRGFSYTVNRGMAYCTDRDVLLLNSDTLVTDRWLEKIRRCADSDSKIGTITPLSNAATIVSFPKFGVHSDLAELPPIEVVNRAIEESAQPSYPDIPTAIGFCMFIRREVILQIGLFDADTFGAGYGEDNDFSVRVFKAGYRNVLCDDTFIAHSNSRSFSDERRIALSRANLQRLGQLHPEHAGHVRQFIQSSPIAHILTTAAERLDALKAGETRGVLHILHGDPGGGTRTHVADLVRHDLAELRQYVLYATGAEWTLESPVRSGGTRTYRFQRRDDEAWVDVLNDVNTFLSIDLCHVHHVSGARTSLVQALRSLRTPYGVTLHDFYLACPTISMLGIDGEYCGAPQDIEECRRCIAGQTKYKNLMLEEWRADHRRVLNDAAFVIVPSNSVSAIYQRYFDRLRVDCIQHGVDTAFAAGRDDGKKESGRSDGFHVVGVLGAIGPQKGARRLERLVARTRERGLRFRWVVIGYTDRIGRNVGWRSEDGLLTVHGPYDRSRLSELTDSYEIDVFVFPSAGPETFSYSLSEAWAMGRPVLVPPIGALGERVAAAGAGWIIDDWKNPDAILDCLVDVFAPENRAEFSRARSRALGVSGRSIAAMAADTRAVYERCIPFHEIRRTSKPGLRVIARMHEAAELGRETPTASRQQPVVAKGSLPSRNASCPCGSGRRHKHCCGTTAAEGQPGTAEQISAEGLRRHQSGRLDEARKLYELALLRDPECGLAQHYLGVILWQTGDVEEAETLLRRSLARLPEQAVFHNNLGLCLSSMWRYEEAAAAYRKALEIDPSSAPTHNNLGLCFQEIGELENALLSFKRALEVAPDSVEARHNLAVVMRSLEQP